MKEIIRAAQFLREGSLVAIPTETVYGLAGDGTDPKAVSKIFEAKNRPSFDPLILHFLNVEAIEPYVVELPSIARKLMNKFSPGPLTLVLKKSGKVPDIVTSGLDKVAVRIPSHPLTLKVLKELDFPLAAPSANLFGRTSPTKPEHVKDQLGDKVSMILDGGASLVGVESTILDISDNAPVILRYGGLSQESIEEFLGVRIEARTSSSKPSAPGMIDSHYSPGYPVQLVVSTKEISSEELSPFDAFLNFSRFRKELPEKRQFVLSQDSNLNEAASRLFDGLRKLGCLKPNKIWAEIVPDKGLGRAINDRLKRASAKSRL